MLEVFASVIGTCSRQRRNPDQPVKSEDEEDMMYTSSTGKQRVVVITRVCCPQLLDLLVLLQSAVLQLPSLLLPVHHHPIQENLGSLSAHTTPELSAKYQKESWIMYLNSWYLLVIKLASMKSSCNFETELANYLNVKRTKQFNSTVELIVRYILQLVILPDRSLNHILKILKMDTKPWYKDYST